ncbi:tachykinin-like peptides receptor 86C [Asterias amurensis]|uniref:tachykinin-like peptides receptor 86C n=1 Tax=Asterias amurensis TaxID=7602 RepID=UPI003AB1EB7C
MANTTAESVHTPAEWTVLIGMTEGIIGMVLNTLAWLVILRTKNLHNMTNYLLAYLAVIDSLTCFCLFFNFATTTMIPDSEIGRVIYCRLIKAQFVQVIAIYTSSFGLCVVTYERYIGIVHSLHYPRLLSAKKVSVIIFITWMVACLLSIPALFTHVASKDAQQACTHLWPALTIVGQILAMLFMYLLPITFMSWAYYKIQATLKINARQLRQQNVQAAAYELLQARQKVVHMLMIVMGALFVLWTPHLIVNVFIIALKESKDALMIWSDTTQMIFYTNSVINPIIYVFKYKKFRRGFQDMLCCCTGRPVRPNQIAME